MDGELPRRVGRYAVRREIGRGGMGVVYQAHDPDHQREIALKVLIGGDHAGAEAVERFLREGRAGGALDHPNLVRVFHTGWADGLLHVTMEYVGGPSLAQRLARGETLPVDEIVRIGVALADALHAAHRGGYVHRDVKPGNVLFRDDGSPVLGDFGLAAELGRDTSLTRSGLIVGTPAYLAPEATRRQPASPASDQYALGAVLWHLLAGRPPYQGDSANDLVFAVIEGPPPPLASVAPTVPRPLVDIVETAIRRDPAARYPDCAALAADLRRFARGEGVVARGLGPLERARGWLERHRTGLLRVGLAVGAALVGKLGWDVWRADVEQERRQEREREAVAALAATAHTPEALRELARDPRYAGTRAATRATLDAARADPIHAIDHYAAAYASAAEPADQDEALRGLAGGFRETWRQAALARVLASIATRTPGALADPTLARWKQEAEVARRHFGGHGVPLLDRLARARPLGSATTVSRVGDSDGDGVAEWWHAEGGALLRTELAPGLATREHARWDGEIWNFQVVDDGVVVSHGPETHPDHVTVAVDGGRSTFPSDAANDALRLDDGSVLLAIGPYARRLLRWQDGVVTSPAPAIDALASDLNVLTRWDADGDGVLDLAMAVGAWSAYDLRIYRGTAVGEAPMFREKLGFLRDVVPRGEHLWTLDSDEYPSRLMFPPDQPYGAPAAAVRWRRSPDGPVRDVVLRSPAPVDRPVAAGDLLLADLDGDGVDEATWTVEVDGVPWLVCWPGADPAAEPWVVEDLRPLFAADLDPAPGAELAVMVPDPLDPERGAVWLLGAGDEVLPALPDLPPAQPPGGPQASWRRAEELVAMGLAAPAAEELRRLADATGDAGPRIRAAELWSSIGDDASAGAALLAAATMTERPDLFDRAAAALLSSHEFPSAVAASASAGHPAAAVEAELASLATASLDFADGVPAEVAVLDPTDVTLDRRRGGVETWLVAGDTAPLAIAYDHDAGRLSVALDLTVDRAEWGSGFVATAGDVELAMRTWGGGELLERELACRVGDRRAVSVREAVTGPDDAVRLRLSADLSTAAGTWRCVLDSEDGARRVETGPLPEGVAAGAGRLVLAPSDHASTEGLATRIVLHAVDLAGSGLAARPAPAAGPGPWEIVALADSGHDQEAATRLRTMRGDLVPELRSRLGTLLPVVEATRGDEAFVWFDRAFSGAFQAHPTDAEVLHAFTTGLPTLSARAPHLERELRPIAARLLVKRARAWLALGQPGAAERDLATALPLLDDAAELGLDLALAWLDLASEVRDREGPERAAALVERARDAAPSEIVDDLVALRPSLAPP